MSPFPSEPCVKNPLIQKCRFILQKWLTKYLIRYIDWIHLDKESWKNKTKLKTTNPTILGTEKGFGVLCTLKITGSPCC